MTLKRKICNRFNAPPNKRKKPEAPFFCSTKSAKVLAKIKLLCQCNAIFKFVDNELVANAISGVYILLFNEPTIFLYDLVFNLIDLYQSEGVIQSKQY